MNELLSHTGIALLTFAVTNLDDLLILSVYFANPAFSPKSIVAGQYLGVMTLVMLSFLGFLFASFLDDSWLNYFGIVPIFLGLKQLYNYLKKENKEPGEIKLSSRQTLSVAVVTIANGGDNLGVYTPLFANISVGFLPVYLLVFVLMIALWCFVAFKFVNHRFLNAFLQKTKLWLLPVFLIVLGLFILFS